MYRNIKQLLRENNIKGALAELEIILAKDPRINELIIQSGRYESLSSKSRKGLISFEEANIENNKITAALLELITELEEHSSNSFFSKITNFQLVSVVAISLFIGLSIFWNPFNLPSIFPFESVSQKENQSSQSDNDISIETKGNNSPALDTKDDVTIEYNNSALDSKENESASDLEQNDTEEKDKSGVNIETSGNNSPAIRTDGKVIINFGEETSKTDSNDSNKKD